MTVFKAWVEMAHRYVASGLGLLIIALVVVGWRSPRASTPLALATLGWVILQGMFGMWTVTMRLQPAIVTAHLLGALVLLGLLLAQWQRIEQPPPGADGSAGAVDPALARMAGVVVVLVFVQAALGAWVSSNYATLACQDFPRCQGQWWPTMDLRAGFQWVAPAGSDRRRPDAGVRRPDGNPLRPSTGSLRRARRRRLGRVARPPGISRRGRSAMR